MHRLASLALDFWMGSQKSWHFSSLFVSPLEAQSEANFWKLYSHIVKVDSHTHTTLSFTHVRTRTVMNFSEQAMHSETIPTPHTHTALPAQLAISPGLSDSRRCFRSLAPSAPRLERRKSAASSSSSSSSLRGWPSCVEVWRLWDTIPLKMLAMVACVNVVAACAVVPQRLVINFSFPVCFKISFYSLVLRILHTNSAVIVTTTFWKQTTRTINKTQTGHWTQSPINIIDICR